MATVTPKKTTPRAKAPQDRKPKAVEVEKPLAPEETPGWELMQDFSDIPVWDQTPLLGLFQDALGGAEDGEEEGTKSFDINIVGDLSKAILPFAKDEKELIKFMSGAGALERSMTLVMAWVGQMGEFGSSEA